MSLLRKTVILGILLVFSATALLAQSEGQTGQIIGTVSDSSGALVPGAKVTISNMAPAPPGTSPPAQKASIALCCFRPGATR